MIKVSHLNYEYPGKRALKDVSFSVAEGSVTALVGPNGAGKTTLLRCMAALDEPFSGEIEIAGVDVAMEPRRVHQVLGYLSDFFGLYEDLTVQQCMTFAAWLHKMPDDKVEVQVKKVAFQLGLINWMHSKVKTLSRGWRQRLGIAQAIIHSPKLLLLDEPAAGLDPEARIILSKLFRDLRSEGMTLVVSSHILAELEDYCTDMLVLRDGEIVEHREASTLKEQFINLHITFSHDAETYFARLRETPGIIAPVLDGQAIRFKLSGGENEQQALLKKLFDLGAPIKSFEGRTERLQDIYMSLGNKVKPNDAH